MTHGAVFQVVFESAGVPVDLVMVDALPHPAQQGKEMSIKQESWAYEYCRPLQPMDAAKDFEDVPLATVRLTFVKSTRQTFFGFTSNHVIGKRHVLLLWAIYWRSWAS